MADKAKKKDESVEEKLRSRFNDDFTLAKKFNDPIHMRMDSDYEMYRNRWSSHMRFKVSKFFSYIETIVPFMVNSRVRGSVKAEFPEYIKHAEGMNYILEHTFDANNWDYTAQRIAKMAEIYRYSLAYTGYDAEAANGTGKLCIDEVNPRWCYVDSAVTDLQESSYFFYSEPMRVSKCIQKYADKADDIKRSVSKRNESMGVGEQGKTRQWFQTWFTAVRNFLMVDWTNKQASNTSDFLTMDEIDEAEKRSQSVAYIHYWYRDDDDKWRVSYWADDVFLEDSPNPFNHGQLPYVAYVPTEDILSAVGLPIGEHIENINTELNTLITEIIDNVKLANDPPAIRNTAYGNLKEKQALTEQRKLNGVIDVNNPDFVPLNAIFDFLNVPQVAAGAFGLNQILKEIEDEILGTNDTMRGMGDATSGKETQLKQEAAYTRIKTKIDNFEKFNKLLSEQIIQNAMQFIDYRRPFRVNGDYRQYQDMNEENENAPFEVKPIPKGKNEQTGEPEYDKGEFFLYANPNEWTKILEPETDEQGNPVYEKDENGQNVMEDVDGEQKPKQKQKEAFRVLQMVVDIEAGSSLPTSQSARREEAADLFKAGAIDQQALLEAYEYPQADEIMKRMQAAAQAQQQAQAQAEQAKTQQQMQLKQMELEAKTQMNQADNQAKMQQVQAKNQPAQPTEPARPDLASGIDAIRAAVPELANKSDDEILQLVANMGKG